MYIDDLLIHIPAIKAQQNVMNSLSFRKDLYQSWANPLNNEESATVRDDGMLTLISTKLINILNDIHRHCQVCSQIIAYGKSVNEFRTSVDVADHMALFQSQPHVPS